MGVYVLDGVGGRAWQLVGGQRQVGDGRNAIRKESEVCSEEADVVRFPRQLKQVAALRAV